MHQHTRMDACTYQAAGRCHGMHGSCNRSCVTVLTWWTPAAPQGFRGWAREVGVMAWRILLAPLTLTVTTQEYSLIR
jgi:hypothetical protein